ncbi:1610_t:CDS:2 [Paraglomus occultum]|uniref:1610_t:CDS:1 n=1 Tax=Paraglomus occultum TaxID=144539 RepID=A0A9N9FGL9_9GLOM|nr:1610_t:CDS:2 [Paraglomus occultum]
MVEQKQKGEAQNGHSPNSPTANCNKRRPNKKRGRIAKSGELLVDAGEARKNNELCDACGTPGTLICCDLCPRTFHFYCVFPVLSPKSPPTGEWYCDQCICDRHYEQITRNRGRNQRQLQVNGSPSGSQTGQHSTQSQKKIGSIKSRKTREALSKIKVKQPPPLLSQLEHLFTSINPKQYRLPADIEEYFEGVTVGTTGEYVDASKRKPVKLDKNSMEILPDYYQIKDEQTGKYIYCHACGKTAKKPKKIIACDYCDLWWHLDCLDPPMVVPPPIDRQWMCPCHADHLLPRKRKVRDAPVSTFGESLGSDCVGLEDDVVEYEEVYVNSKKYKLPKKGVVINWLGQMHQEQERRQRSKRRAEEEQEHIVKKMEADFKEPDPSQYGLWILMKGALTETGNINDEDKA